VIEEPVGDKYHLLICPALKFVTAIGSANILKRFLNQFSTEFVGIIPYQCKDRTEEVLDWDVYKKITFSIDAPNEEAVSGMLGGKLNLFEVMPLSHSGALRMNISLGNPQALSLSRVRDIISGLVQEGYCVSLRVTGCYLEGQPVQTVDLKREPVVYDAVLELDGHYLSDGEVRNILLAAVNEKAEILKKGI
jgi:hypothetical protein